MLSKNVFCEKVAWMDSSVPNKTIQLWTKHGGELISSEKLFNIIRSEEFFSMEIFLFSSNTESEETKKLFQINTFSCENILWIINSDWIILKVNGTNSRLEQHILPRININRPYINKSTQNQDSDNNFNISHSSINNIDLDERSSTELFTQDSQHIDIISINKPQNSVYDRNRTDNNSSLNSPIDNIDGNDNNKSINNSNNGDTSLNSNDEENGYNEISSSVINQDRAGVTQQSETVSNKRHSGNKFAGQSNNKKIRLSEGDINANNIINQSNNVNNIENSNYINNNLTKIINNNTRLSPSGIAIFKSYVKSLMNHDTDLEQLYRIILGKSKNELYDMI